MTTKTFKTVEAATELAFQTAQEMGLSYSKDSLKLRIYNWYDNSDVTDIYILAGCALCGSYFQNATYDDMLTLADRWFPPINFNDNKNHDRRKK